MNTFYCSVMNKVKHFSTLVSFNLLVSIVTFLHLLALAKYIGAEEYGHLSTFLVYGTFVLQFALFGSSESGVYLLSNGWSKHQLVMFRIFNIIISLCVLVVCAIFLSSYLPIYVLFCSFTGFGLAVIFEYESKTVAFSKLFLVQKIFSIGFIWICLLYTS
ncbi:hypothetical protein F0243_28310, partial [Vibrio mediterranei]